MRLTSAIALSCAALLVLVVAVGGCGGTDLDTDNSALTTRIGVDYSWYRPAPSTLVADGYTFVARYLSTNTTGKALSKSEADSLIAVGLDLVVVFEDGADNALSGYNQGVADAQVANSQALADGAPATRPIYFAVDFDATAAQQATINAYFDGVASVIGRPRTGAYGGYSLIQRLFDAGKIQWGWQTYAWSYGNWDARAQVRQTQNGIAGGQMDKDEAVADDFGQWPGVSAQCSGPIGHPLGNGGKVSGACGGSAPNPPAPSGCGALASGEGLTAGKSLASCDGRFVLVMQGDGNVVMYTNGIALWSSGTSGTTGASFVMQTDGNLVLYSATGCPLWASGTSGKSGATLAVQDDGNLVVYSGATAVWASGTGSMLAKVTGCGSIPSGHALEPGGSVSACGGCFDLVMQSDGNLVLYQKGGKALWSSGTAGKDGYAAQMQGDGDFVLYSKAGCTLWESATKSGGAWLALQDDGNVVVYSSANAPLWSSGTNVCANGCNCLPPAGPDAGAPPAGPDAATPTPGADAGMHPKDAGSPPSETDAAEEEFAADAQAQAQAPDSGLAGSPDAAKHFGDASQSGTEPASGGCGCGTASSSGFVGFASLLALAALARRRPR